MYGCGGGARRERHICRLHCAHVVRILEANLRGIQEEKEAGNFRRMQRVPIPVKLATSSPSLLYHVENSRTKTFLNIRVCKKSFFFIRAFFLFFVFCPWKVDKQP